MFEGEYLNGKINGKGKEYDYNWIIIFKGKYLNGERYSSFIFVKYSITLFLLNFFF